MASMWGAGHRADGYATAGDRGVSSCVVTFDPHPAACGHRELPVLTSLDDRLEYSTPPAWT